MIFLPNVWVTNGLNWSYNTIKCHNFSIILLYQVWRTNGNNLRLINLIFLPRFCRYFFIAVVCIQFPTINTSSSKSVFSIFHFVVFFNRLNVKLQHDANSTLQLQFGVKVRYISCGLQRLSAVLRKEGHRKSCARR